VHFPISAPESHDKISMLDATRASILFRRNRGVSWREIQNPKSEIRNPKISVELARGISSFQIPHS
jgi:hypothetical protein